MDETPPLPDQTQAPQPSAQMPYEPVSTAPKLSFFQEPTPPVIGTADALSLANKYDYTMADKSPGLNPIFTQITSGNEAVLRNQMALQKDMQDQRTKLSLINGITQFNQGKPLSTDQYDYIQSLTPQQVNNPKTIFETEYAKKLFSDMLFSNPDHNSQVKTAGIQDAPKTDALLDVAQDNLAKDEIVRKRWSELSQKQASFNGPLEGLNTFIQDIIPFYHSFVVHGGPTFELPGNDLHKIYRELRNLSPDAFAEKFNQTVDRIASQNISWAQQFIQGYMDETSSGQFWGNVQGALDYGTLLPFGAASKAKAVPEAIAGAGAAGPTAAESIAAIQKVGKTVTQDATAYATEHARIDAEYTKQLDELDTIRKEAGASITDPEYLAHKDRINKQYQADLGDLKQVGDERVQELMKTIQGITDAAQSNSVPQVLAAGGKTQEASKAAALSSAKIDAGAGLDSFNTVAKDLVSHIPEHADPASIFKGAYNLSETLATKLVETLDNIASKIDSSLINRLAIERLGSDASRAAAMSEAIARFATETNINDSVASVRILNLPAEGNTLTNTSHIQFDLMRPDGKLFTSAYNAGYYASDTLKLKGFETVQVGDGWLIRTTRPYDETSNGVRDALLTTENLTPEGKYGINGLGFSWLRSADQLLGKSQKENRQVLVHGLQGISAAVSELTKPIQALSKASRADLSRFLTHLADDFRTKGAGADIKTLGTFTERWLAVTGKLPSGKEAAAYFATREMYNFDWMLRNISAYTAFSRQGITKMSVSGVDFYGKILDNTSVLESGHYGLLVDGDPRYFYQRRTGGGLTAAEIDIYKGMVEDQGYKLIQVAKPWDRPFKASNGNLVNYVLTKDLKASPLKLDVIAYDPSNIVKYDYRHAVVQPRISPLAGRNTFLGDSMIMQAQTAKEAAGWAKALEYVRQEYNATKLDQNVGAIGPRMAKLRDFIDKNLPFASEHILEAIDDGRIHPDHPITSTPAGKASIDNPTFKTISGVIDDGRKDPYDLAHGIDQMKDESPVLKLDQQKIIDPLVGIGRSLNRMSHNAFLSDYQIASAEQFVREFRDTLNVSQQSLDANPIAHLMNPEWATNIPASRLQLAKNFQTAVKNLLQSQNYTAKVLQAWRGQVYEAVFDKYGAKAADVASNYVLPLMQDPLSLIRAATQHLKIGLGNPTQFFKQLQTLAISSAIVGPTVSYKAMTASMMLNVYRLGKVEFLEHFDALAAKAGLKAGDLTLIQKLAEKSKLLQVEGEHIYNENLIDPNIITTPFGKILSWGQIPWREGERQTRSFALNASFIEWRGKNPDAVLNRAAEMSILQRADVLNVNMTKASQSSLQAGSGNIWSDISRSRLQFASYQMRVWELMLGHTLTIPEKLRVFGMQSILYGIPIGVGTVVPNVSSDAYRQVMSYLGNDPVPNQFVELMTKGIPETFMHMITGKENDFGQIMGAPSLSIFKNTGEASLLSTLFGASGTVFGQIVETTFPVIQDLWEIGDPEAWARVTVPDLLTLSRNISSVNYGMKLYYAATAGQVLSSRGTLLADNVNTIDGMMMAVFGVSPQEIGDIGNFLKISQFKQAAKDFAAEQITKYMLEYSRADDAVGRKAALHMATRWALISGMNGEELQKVQGRALSSNAGLFDKLNQELKIDRLKHTQPPLIPNLF